MGLDRRLKKIEKTIRNVRLNEPLIPVVEISIENREQVALVATLPDSLETLCPEKDAKKKSLAFHEYVDRIPKRPFRPEDRPAWEEQRELSRQHCAAAAKRRE